MVWVSALVAHPSFASSFSACMFPALPLKVLSTRALIELLFGFLANVVS